MKLLFLVYFATGAVIGPFCGDGVANAAMMDWLTLAGMHVPALLLTALGFWHGRKHGRFLGQRTDLFLVSALLSYGAGVAIGFCADI